MSESGELPDPEGLAPSSLPAEPSYQEIRDEIANTAEPQEAEETPAEMQERPGKNPDPPKRQWERRPRKDLTCAKCGKVFSSNTRRRNCIGPKESAPPEAMGAPRPLSPPKEKRALTLDEVRSSLSEERTKYRAAQRDAWVGCLF